jgi:hypothetical protein
VSEETHWKKLGANVLVRVNDGVQVIYVPKADIQKQIKDILGHE